MSLTINGSTNTLTAASGLTVAGNTTVTGTLSATGITSVTDVTDATSTTAASLKTAGGLAVAKKAYFGSEVRADSASAASVSAPAIGVSNNRIVTFYDAVSATTNCAFLWCDTSNNFNIGAGNGTRIQISSAGVTTLGTTTDSSSTTTGALIVSGGVGIAKKLYVGDNIVMVSGKGIDFSATANGSGTTQSEVLSDYEEGTWTGAFTFATPGNLVATVTCPGRYTKTGRQVTATFELDSSVFTHTTASSFARITGLPFTPAFDAYNGAGNWGGITAAGYTSLSVRAIASQTYLQFVLSGSGQALVGLNSTHMPTGGTVALYGTITYFV